MMVLDRDWSLPYRTAKPVLHVAIEARFPAGALRKIVGAGSHPAPDLTPGDRFSKDAFHEGQAADHPTNPPAGLGPDRRDRRRRRVPDARGVGGWRFPLRRSFAADAGRGPMRDRARNDRGPV